MGIDPNTLRIYNDPAFAGKIQQYTGQTNPFNINSSNPVEKQKAYDWYNTQSNFLTQGSPQRPQFAPNTNPDGSIKSVFQLNPGDLTNQLTGNINGVNLDKTALGALQSRATSTEASPWAKLALQNQALTTQNSVDKAHQSAQQGYGNAYSSLASSGGLSSGARERLARSAAEGETNAAQNVYNQGNAANLQIGLQDQSTKDQMLEQLPGQQLAASGFDLSKANADNAALTGQQTLNTNANQFNISNALSDTLQKRASDLDQYNEQMKAWAANTASANAPSGKK